MNYCARLSVLVLVVMGFFLPCADAQVVHRCKGTDGSITITDRGCDANQTAVKREAVTRPIPGDDDGGSAMDHYTRYLQMQQAERDHQRQEQADAWAASTTAENAIAQRNAAEANARRARIAAGSLRQYGNSARADREIRQSIVAGSSSYRATGGREEDNFRSQRAPTTQMPARSPDDDEAIRRSFVNGNGDTFTPNENGYSSATGGGQFYDKGNNRYYNAQSGMLCKRELNEMKCQ